MDRLLPKRRFWIKEKTFKNIDKSNINDHLLTSIDDKEYSSYESIICDPIKVYSSKKKLN